MIRTTSAFLPGSRLPTAPSRPSARAPPRGGPLHDLLGAQVAVRDRLALHVRLEVLAGPVGAERGAHRGEEVAAPPDARVHGQRHRDVVVPQRPRRRITLARTLLALGGDGHRASAGGDPVVGVLVQCRGMDVDRLGGRIAVVVDEPDAVVVGGAPDAGVRGDRRAEVAGDLEGGTFRERRIARDVERHLEAEHVVARREPPAHERAELRPGRPLPRAGLDVAVGEDEPPGNRLQRVDGGLGVVGRLQAVRPVDRRRDAGVERLDRRQQVARVDVLGTEALAVFQVVPDEVLRERPVGAVAAHGGLPHVPVGVDHAGQHDAARGVDLDRAVGHRQLRADGLDPLADDEDVGRGEDRVAGVHREHGPAPEDQRPTCLRGAAARRGRCVHELLHWRSSRSLEFAGRMSVWRSQIARGHDGPASEPPSRAGARRAPSYSRGGRATRQAGARSGAS